MRKTILLLLIVSSGFVKAQSVPLGTALVEDYLRRQQLLGNLDSTFSFNFRPIVLSKNGLDLDSTIFETNQYFKTISRPFNEKGVIKILPVEFRLAYDHNYPDSRNDGAMIRSRGFQTLISAGLFAELGPLSIQLKPEFVWAENKDYDGFPAWPRHWESTWQLKYLWYNRSDIPERYGTSSYSKVLPGQSSIRLNKWGISLGLSTENIWWGPGMRNSIMMSNNAQGFAHLTFNTQRPLKTIIGSFEWQFLTGRLEGSGYPPPGYDQAFRGRVEYVPKPDDWRYFQAITFSYSPKWIKGLSLGFTRWVQQYNEVAKSTNDYFPVFSNLFRKNDNNTSRIEINRDQAASLFGRWVWFDAKAEIYFEYAKNDASINFRDLLIDTDHSRAINVGINKIFETQKENNFWQFNFEWTQTSQTESRLLRDAKSWYIHSRLRHGYTNNGEVLGSALGPGGNSQYLQVAKVNGIDRIGGAIERFVHNNDFNVRAFSQDFTRYWVDYSFSGFYEKRLGKLMFSTSLMYTYSINYQWEAIQESIGNTSTFDETPGVDKNNWNFDLKLAYSF